MLKNLIYATRYAAATIGVAGLLSSSSQVQSNHLQSLSTILDNVISSDHLTGTDRERTAEPRRVYSFSTRPAEGNFENNCVQSTSKYFMQLTVLDAGEYARNGKDLADKDRLILTLASSGEEGYFIASSGGLISDYKSGAIEFKTICSEGHSSTIAGKDANKLFYSILAFYLKN